MNTGEKIRLLRLERNWSQETLARKIGYTSRSTIQKIEIGKSSMPQSKLKKVADIFGVSPADLLDDEPFSNHVQNLFSIKSMPVHRVPLIGSIAAGIPILAETDYDVYIDSPCKADYALRVQGDSMEPDYLDGDIVYIRAQDDCNDGETAAVIVGESATLKHVYHIKNGLLLISNNPKYQPMEIKETAYNDSDIHVLGIPCGFTRMFRKKAE